MDRHRKPTKRSFSKNFPSGTPSASSSQPPYPWPTTSSQQSLAGSSTELPQPPPFMSFLPPPPFPIPMTSAFASTPSPMMPIFSPMIMPSGPFLPGQAPFSPFSIPPPNMPMSFPPPSINTAISDSTSNLKLEMISPPDSEKSERKRKRKAEKQESKEKERKKKKPKFVSKALTLGELVQEAKQRKSEKDDSEKSKKKKKKVSLLLSFILLQILNFQKEKDLESYLESASTLEEENALLRKADELPPVTEHDYDEININDEGEQFDPNTVKVPISRRRIRLANSCDTVIGSEEFEEKVLNFAQNKRASQPQCPPSIQLSQMFHNHGCRCGQPSDESDDDSDAEQRKQRTAMENKQKENIVRSEIDRKRTHPAAISSDICFNEPEMANDGPICKCSQKAKQGDMRHGYYPGEQPIPLILHRPLPEFFPRMPISHWSSEYEFHLIQEEIPENTFTIHELEVFYSFVFDELLELADVKRFSPNVKEGCPFYHVMPRFVAKTMERGETYKLLPMRIVLKLISENFRPLFTEQSLNHLSEASEEEFKNATVKFKQQLLFRGDKKPTTLRADNFFVQNGKVMFDHQTNKPSIYVSGHNPILQALQRRIHKMKHLHSIKGLDPYEQSKMDDLQKEIEKMRNETCETRRVTVQLPCEGYFQTGLFPDVTVHAILLLLATHHVRTWKLASDIGFKIVASWNYL
ncbi:hypothetical protein WR25_00299 [Diploscapter pachys]|uniref:Ribonuclease 3 central domain-containing protein n=1 Tax=Diploscapter pachys TaxID=2018661 RepID=A0A2A2J6A5_9BILA|nr:hypothetical protein WR25_00299 [Diploscapter pachys]